MPINLNLLPPSLGPCQAWKIPLRVNNKIRTYQRSMERGITNVEKIQKMSREKIRKKTKDKKKFSQKLKWRWAGHVARLNDDRWTSTLTLWRGPAGLRKKGRPITRWKDDIVKEAGKKWITTAKNREKWQSLEEAFNFT